LGLRGDWMADRPRWFVALFAILAASSDPVICARQAGRTASPRTGPRTRIPGRGAVAAGVVSTRRRREPRPAPPPPVHANGQLPPPAPSPRLPERPRPTSPPSIVLRRSLPLASWRVASIGTTGGGPGEMRLFPPSFVGPGKKRQIQTLVAMRGSASVVSPALTPPSFVASRTAPPAAPASRAALPPRAAHPASAHSRTSRRARPRPPIPAPPSPHAAQHPPW
jgi:hypothetical protein